MSYVAEYQPRIFKFVDVVEGVTIAELEIDESCSGPTDEKQLKKMTDKIFHKLTKTYSPQRLRVIEQ